MYECTTVQILEMGLDNPACILKSQKIPFGAENFINSTVNAKQLMLTYQNKLPSLRFSSLWIFVNVNTLQKYKMCAVYI